MTDTLVTGATGFVGRHVVAALADRGDRVRVLALPGEGTGKLESQGVTVFRGDIRDPGTLSGPMSGAGAVVHLAALMGSWCPLTEYRAVNVGGTLNVCRAALTAGVRRLVHVSSSCVYGCGLGQPVDETFPIRPFPDAYPVSKAEADLAVQRLIATDKLPAVIVRPDQIFGPGDWLHFGQMADRLGNGSAVVVGSGTNALPLVHIDDAVAAILIALDHPAAVGRVYNITNDDSITQVDLLRAIAYEIGARPPRWHLPYRSLYAAGWAAERLARLSGNRFRPPTTRFGVAFIGTDWHSSAGRAREELGFQPQVDILEGVRRTAAWYRTERQNRSAAAEMRASEVNRARA